MSKDLCIIPARVIFNWDFRKYTVNADAANFFKEFRYEPFIDIDVSSFFAHLVLINVFSAYF